MSTNKLAGKIALITGGSSGLGLATAKQFIAKGAYVFITGRRQPELDAAAKEIGSNVTTIRGDIANLADLDRLFATIMPAGGAIVLNASMVSIKGFPGFGVYAATKAALRSFARTWAVDLKGRNIRVNAVSPGTVVTPAYKSELGLSDEQIKGFVAQAAAATPLGRTGTPDEVAKAVVFLASDDASFVNGIELFVDGGAAQI